jgi:SAM-dependent methyltransferase
VSASSATPRPGSPTPFDGQAPEFDRRVGLPEDDCRAIAAAVLDTAEAHAGDRVVEIGAGTGMIGRWFLDHPVRYVGLDLSRGMLERFRRRPGGEKAGLVQADASRPWPLPADAAAAIFSSRAIHLLPPAAVAEEVLRVGAAGGALLLGWVERRPESVKGRLSRRMRQLVRERGFEPRRAGGRELLAALRRRGARELPRQAVVRRPARQAPREALAQWRGKLGLGGVVLPPGVQEEVLEELEAWAVRELGDLDAERESEESYVLEGVRFPRG